MAVARPPSVEAQAPWWPCWGLEQRAALCRAGGGGGALSLGARGRRRAAAEGCFLVKVSFDSTKHLSDASIKKRQLERQKLQELEQQREEQKRREKEAEQRQRAEERCAGRGPGATRALPCACVGVCVYPCVRRVLLCAHACSRLRSCARVLVCTHVCAPACLRAPAPVLRLRVRQLRDPRPRSLPGTAPWVARPAGSCDAAGSARPCHLVPSRVPLQPAERPAVVPFAFRVKLRQHNVLDGEPAAVAGV